MPRRRHPGLVVNEEPPAVAEAEAATVQVIRLELNAERVKPKMAKLEDVDYLVVPTVLICEGVHNGLFYPAEELKKFPQAWNGRPIPVFHPTDNEGNAVTANSPETIEKCTVGKLFNVKWNAKSKKLLGEAWISPVKCAALGEDGAAVLNAVQTSTTMEVSTGLFVDVMEQTGTWNNETYEGVAVNHRPDHFALLPSGVGACSVSDGAGFPRVNAEADKVRAMMAQLSSGLRVLREFSLNDKQRLLRDALTRKYGSSSKEAPSYTYLEDVYEKEVIFSIEGNGQTKLMKVGYSVNGKGEVTIGPDAAEAVRRVTSYEPVTNEQAPAKEGSDSMDPKDKTTEAAPTPNGQPASPPAKAHTIEELLGNADDSLKANVQDALEAQKAVRESLIGRITANKVNQFKVEELASMSTAQLGKLAVLADVAPAPAPEVEKKPETEEAEAEVRPNAKKPSFAGNDAGPAPATGQKIVANAEQPDGSGVPLPPKLEFKRR